jgi:hypothetical protein|tara:strand:- start:3073 stop:3282 length:210 start_codon:yes stop_codon:yes gene_type:complete
MIDISTETNTMTSKYKIYEGGRKTPYKYEIKFNRSSINDALHGDYMNLSDFFEMLDEKINKHHKEQIQN